MPKTNGYRKFKRTDNIELALLWRQAFGITDGDSQRGQKRYGADNLRVWNESGKVMACLAAIPSKQYWGGKPVKTMGIAAFAVDASCRGQGLGTKLLHQHLEEASREKYALSVLYPATWNFYRHAGYELSGTTIQYKLDLPLLPTSRHLGKACRAEAAKIIASAKASHTENGNFDQVADIQAWLEDGLWRWNYRVPDAIGDGYLLLNAEGKQIGHTVINHQKGGALWILSHAADGEYGAKTFLNFLAGYRSSFETAYLLGNTTTPLTLTLPEKAITIADSFPWMLRIIDVENALKQRGYPKGLKATLAIKVNDDFLPINNSFFILNIQDGNADVRKTSRLPEDMPFINLAISALAPLYTGHATASSLQYLGRLSGSKHGVDNAALIFSGSPPWINGLF